MCKTTKNICDFWQNKTNKITNKAVKTAKIFCRITKIICDLSYKFFW